MRIALMATGLVLAIGAAHADVAPPREDRGEGTWYGQMRQVNVEGEESYPMVLRLTGSGGRSEYPKLNCGGELERLGSASGGYVVYKETITRGGTNDGKESACVDGVVVIHVEKNELVLGWFGAIDGEPYLASARLTRGQFNSK